MRTTAARALSPVLWFPLAVIAAVAPAPAQHPATPQRGGFPEGQAAITHVLVNLDRDAAQAAFPVYRDLARSLPRDVRVTAAVAAPDRIAGARLLLYAAGFEPARVRVVTAGAPVTLWARDRVVALQGEDTELLTPAPDRVPLERIGDIDIARALAPLLPATRHVPSPLWFEGGNILFSSSHVMVGANGLACGSGAALTELRLEERAAGAVLLRPLTSDAADARAVADALQAALGKDVVVIGAPDDLPHEHIDMFMTVIDDRTVLLGDPSLGAAFIADSAAVGLGGRLLPDIDQWTEETQRQFEPGYERIRRQLCTLGMRVERIPILHGAGGALLTWNNALVELREDGRRAYVPMYGVAQLDERAAEAYRQVGCRVYPIDAARVIELGGAVRCMVNVIGWREARLAPAR